MVEDTSPVVWDYCIRHLDIYFLYGIRLSVMLLHNTSSTSYNELYEKIKINIKFMIVGTYTSINVLYKKMGFWKRLL